MFKIAFLAVMISTAASAQSDGCRVEGNLHYCNSLSPRVAKMQCTPNPCLGAVDPSTHPGNLQIYQADDDGFIYIPRELLRRDHSRLLNSMKEFP